MRAQEGNLSTDNTAFRLQGGRYMVSVTATFGGGSVKLQKLETDGSTYLSVGSSSDFTAAGFAVVEVGPGTYRWTIATSTAVKAALDRVPGE